MPETNNAVNQLYFNKKSNYTMYFLKALLPKDHSFIQDVVMCQALL